ncbi:Patatin-like phospholipase [Enhygromyxa salina]|uniref:Patatin-like phospholipase n=1 Tax=Enhygromyxa salina TaxID=215803 RepID=A0A2S9XB83_9BACT|nr:patatin-like phospholipase family protein [Enhygromyxa salina]PRP90114.1 Patatin-like phospholipase [Enhygromyxa salina]
MADEPSSGLSVVLAGGGCKTFWGMGVLRALDDLLPPVQDWAGTSAGAVMCLVRVSGRVDECYEYFLDVTANNPRNFYPGRVFGGGPVFPHDSIVRRTLRFIMADGGFAAIRRAEPVHILMSYLTAGRPALRTGLAALRNFERRARAGRLHGPLKPPPGLGAQIVRSTDAMDPDQLLDWVVRSSSTPPVTPLLHRGGRRYLDGALIDNAPIRALPEAARRGRILVLLSSPSKVARRWLRLPEGGRVLYLAPADELPVSTWDYTSPDNIAATYELGQRDGELLRQRVVSLLEG